MHKNENLAWKIKQAKTLRDVFSIQLPAVIHDLEDMGSFKSIKTRRQYVNAQIKHDEIKWRTNLLSCFKEACTFTANYEQEIIGEDEKVYMTSEAIKGTNGVMTFHPDQLTSLMRVYLSYNSFPTLIVPHLETLEILEKSGYEDFLDIPIQDVAPLRERISTDRATLKRMEEAAITLPGAKIILMSGATYHSRHRRQNSERCFLRTIAH